MLKTLRKGKNKMVNRNVFRTPKIKKDENLTTGNVSQTTNNTLGNTKPLQNAYDTFKAQAELNKVSAQNELSNANKVAQTYMDNYLKYYGMQGSGMGQSAYTNLAAQNTQNMANVNTQYNQQLADYRNVFNENLKQQAANDLQSLSEADQKTYIENLRGQSGVNEDTISNIQSQANAVNYQREEEERIKTEEENKQLNQNTLDTGSRYAFTMTDENWEAYLDRLDQDPNITDETLYHLQEQRDIYLEDEKKTAEKEASAKAESERNQANSNAWTYGQAYAEVYSDQQWNSYLERLKAEGVDEKVITNLEDYREAYGTNTFENQLDNAIVSTQSAIDDAVENKDYAKQNELKQVLNEIKNANSQEELDAALEKLENIETKPYDYKELSELGASGGTGSNKDPYIFNEASLSELKQMVTDGNLPDGAWVQYKNNRGMTIIRQVNDGKLTEREVTDKYSGIVDTTSNTGTYNDPYIADTYDTNNLKTKATQMIKDGKLKEGNYVKDKHNNVYIVHNGKLVKEDVYKKQQEEARTKGSRADDFENNFLNKIASIFKK